MSLGAHEHRVGHHLPAVVRISPRGIRRDLALVDGWNAKVAVILTGVVGTMWCFWAFNGIALISLPKAIQTGNMTILINWISSNWIQLILLPALMVGQRLQAHATDARTERQFADVELLLDRLNLHTAGGISDLYDALATRLDALEERTSRSSRDPHKGKKT